MLSELNLNKSTELCEIMGFYGSDKGHKNINKTRHNYTILYYELFKNLKNNKMRIFELGLGTNNTDVPSNMGSNGKPGASLFGWRDFFPNSSIYGADIDRRILFESERIKTYYCDQTDANSIREMWENEDLREEFDIIIEDGLHTYEANICFLENSIHKININGIYIIEDLNGYNINRFESNIESWKIKYPNFNFECVRLPRPDVHDNNLVIVRRVS